MTFDRAAYNRALGKRRHRELKDEVYELLGIICRHCGFSDKRALQIDHIHGRGNQQRRRTHPRTLFKQIIEDPDRDLKYQMLCANCNWIKAVESKDIQSCHLTA